MSLGDKTGPYGEAALKYIKAGWPEVLPIWRGGTKDKQPMVRGYHGREGAWPDKDTTTLWSHRYARVNIALRLPRWIVGLDVDHYADKAGGDSLGDLQDKLGPLPGTFVSTARTDGVSGIRLFMLPGDYAASSWPSQAAPDIEMITWYERYVICSPSMHKTGNEYKWYRQSSKFKEMQEYRILPGPATCISTLPVRWLRSTRIQRLPGVTSAGVSRASMAPRGNGWSTMAVASRVGMSKASAFASWRK